MPQNVQNHKGKCTSVLKSPCSKWDAAVRKKQIKKNEPRFCKKKNKQQKEIAHMAHICEKRQNKMFCHPYHTCPITSPIHLTLLSLMMAKFGALGLWYNRLHWKGYPLKQLPHLTLIWSIQRLEIWGQFTGIIAGLKFSMCALPTRKQIRATFSELYRYLLATKVPRVATSTIVSV